MAPWVSLLCGLYALYQASKQMKEARLQTEKLQQVSRALSTQYLGEFPNYLLRVAELIKSAESDLKIMCAIPAHGSFTENQRSTEVRHAIELASHRMAVEFTFNNEERRRASFQLQYPQAVENWDAYIKDPVNVARVTNFLKHTHPDTDLIP